MLLAIRPPDEDVLSLTQQIVAQPRYARWREYDVDLAAQIVRWLDEYLTWSSDLESASPILFWLLMAAFLTVALALLAHIGWSIRVALRPTGPPDIRQPRKGAPRWVEEAEALARDGRFLEGAHRLLLGSIDVLVTRGVIELARADANRVLRDRVRRSRLPVAVRARFLDLLDAFEERWFRDRIEDGDLYRAWYELHAQLRDTARGET